MGQAEGVGPLGVEDFLGGHKVSPRLGHLGTAEADHPLGKEPLERFSKPCRDHAEVGQGLGEEAGIHEVKDGVLHATDVLVNRQPTGCRIRREGRFVIPRIGEPEEVPG